MYPQYFYTGNSYSVPQEQLIQYVFERLRNYDQTKQGENPYIRKIVVNIEVDGKKVDIVVPANVQRNAIRLWNSILNGLPNTKCQQTQKFDVRLQNGEVPPSLGTFARKQQPLFMEIGNRSQTEFVIPNDTNDPRNPFSSDPLDSISALKNVQLMADNKPYAIPNQQTLFGDDATEDDYDGYSNQNEPYVYPSQYQPMSEHFVVPMRHRHLHQLHSNDNQNFILFGVLVLFVVAVVVGMSKHV